MEDVHNLCCACVLDIFTFYFPLKKDSFKMMTNKLNEITNDELMQEGDRLYYLSLLLDEEEIYLPSILKNGETVEFGNYIAKKLNSVSDEMEQRIKEGLWRASLTSGETDNV